LRRFLDRLYAASGALAAVCLASICVLMLAQAVGREFGLLIRAADDITSWLCAASAFLALGHTFRHGELVRVGLFIDRLRPAARRRAEIVALVLTGMFIGYMNVAVAKFVYESWKFKEVAQGLVRIPIWIPQLCFVFGAFILLVAILDELILVLGRHKPTYQLAEEDRRARGDYSELA
jgi:TRAP-type C4-dicarboxylate transport system permease small subunit